MIRCIRDAPSVSALRWIIHLKGSQSVLARDRRLIWELILFLVRDRDSHRDFLRCYFLEVDLTQDVMGRS